jgi:uncharacterized protein GlcG (DUF336 family)
MQWTVGFLQEGVWSGYGHTFHFNQTNENRRNLMMKRIQFTILVCMILAVTPVGHGAVLSGGEGLPSHEALTKALKTVVLESNGGFGLQMWATVVDRDGLVRAVTFSGGDRGDQWPGSRSISAQKANTANAFSLPKLALSTAQLFTAVQPGGSLFGLQDSNPVDTDAAYAGPSKNYGQKNDPLVGKKIGGINVFGGGLALYRADGVLVGALGVSGDSSCADHNIAWKVRHALNLDNIPGGVAPDGTDNIVYDIGSDGEGHQKSASGWGHPACAEAAKNIAEKFGDTHPTGP